MSLNDRIELYKKIEGHRKHPLLVYVTSKRDGVTATMATDALPYLIDQLSLLPDGTTDLDFLIVSYGGDPMVAWRIMSLIRERGVDRVSVLIPQSAYSAATLLALGADEIVMHPNSHLGPIDMQMTTISEERRRQFSTEDMSAFLDFVRETLSITDQRHLRRLFEITCKEVGTLGVGFTVRSSKLAAALSERLLGMHMKEDETGIAKKSLVERLSSQFHAHAYPISRKEAIEMGLRVNKERDPVLESLMWELWLDLEAELEERHPYRVIPHLLNSGEAGKLLSPVPQLNLPCNAAGPSYFTASLTEFYTPAVPAAPAPAIPMVSIDPVDFEHVNAILESPRLSHRGVTRGKILASRLPDLNVLFNELVTFRGWEKTE